MSAEINQNDIDEIKIALNKASWRAPERNFMQIMLIFLMMSLIISSFGMIFWEAVGSTLFGSVSLLSALSIAGASMQIYSYSSDARGY